MKRYLSAGLAVAGLALVAGLAVAQIPVPPKVSVLSATDLIPVIPNGQPTAQSQYAYPTTLAGYSGSLPVKSNVLVGGDATTNLFQRATTGASVTTTTTYGGPDRWFYWSGANTAMTVSRSSTAGDLPSSGGFQYAFKMAKTAAQTGVVQVCMGQALESANSYQFQGQTAELSFYANTGSTFSAASGNMTAYIVYGTGSNESAATMAFGVNAGGGGGAGWTGQANATAAVISLGGVSTNGRYAAVATIPVTATQVGVALCYTPVGTAGANDYVAFSGVQLVRNASLAANVSTTAGYNCVANVIMCSAFDRTRGLAQEMALQHRYYYRVLEAAAVTIRAPCTMSTTSIANCLISFPVTMRTAPTMAYVTGFAASASTASSSVTACTGLTTSATLASSAASVNGVLMNCASSAGFGAAGTAGFLWDNNTATPGQINASAEL